jgi:3-oxoadipate enol-lactonase
MPRAVAARWSTMPYVHTPTSGMQIHYEEAGTGANVLVLVHGNLASWRWWKQVFDRLPPAFRAYAPDLRGCGGTAGSSSPDAYSIPQLARDLLDFVDAVDQRSFHLVGHSLGGAVALQFALEHPGRLLSLTLVAPAPATGLAGLREGNSIFARTLRSINPEHASTMAVLQSSYGLHRALGTSRLMLRGALARMMPTATLERAEIETLLGDAARMSPVALMGFLLALHRWNVAGELGTLGVPTLIFAGGKDALVPMTALQQMVQLLANGRLVVWPEVGHSPQVERPDAFVRRLVDWTQRNVAVQHQALDKFAALCCTATSSQAIPASHEGEKP